MDSSSGELWYVKLADGDVHRVTLDQLDEAFQAGHIDGDTMVLEAGSSQWKKLGELAGIDDDAVPIDAAPVQQLGYPAPAAQQVAAAYAQTQVAQRAPASVAPSYSNGMPAYNNGANGYGSVAPAYGQGAPSQGAANGYGYGNGHASQAPRAAGVPSYAAPAAGVPGYARPAAGVPSYAPPAAAPMPTSLRPVSFELDDDLDQPFRRRSGGKKWVALLMVAALGGGAATIVAKRPAWAQPMLNHMGLHGTEETAVASAPPPVVTPPADPTPAPPPPAAEPVPPPAVAAPVPGNDSPMSPHFTSAGDRLTDDQKTRLADADKKGHHPKAHASGGGGSHVSAPSSKGKSTTFTTGGSKYDPLNSSI